MMSDQAERVSGWEFTTGDRAWSGTESVECGPPLPRLPQCPPTLEERPALWPVPPSPNMGSARPLFPSSWGCLWELAKEETFCQLSPVKVELIYSFNIHSLDEGFQGQTSPVTELERKGSRTSQDCGGSSQSRAEPYFCHL